MKCFNEWLESMGKKYFVGNCVHCLDDEWFTGHIASDATELEQIIEDGTNITKEEFLNMCDIQNYLKLKDGFEFGFNKNKDLAWAYDPNKDIHYFFN